MLGGSGERLGENLGPAVRAVVATPAGVTGRVDDWAALRAAIVRPDGYVAWAAGSQESEPTSGRDARESEAAQALRPWMPGLVPA